MSLMNLLIDLKLKEKEKEREELLKQEKEKTQQHMINGFTCRFQELEDKYEQLSKITYQQYKDHKVEPTTEELDELQFMEACLSKNVKYVDEKVKEGIFNNVKRKYGKWKILREILYPEIPITKTILENPTQIF